MKRIAFFVFAVALLAGCASGPGTAEGAASNTETPTVNTATLKSDIEALKAFFASQSGKELDKAKANEMVEKSQQFAEAFPNDPTGGGYLFMAGEVARSLGRYEDAINLFTKVETDYPNHERAPSALFLKGFTYEENLRNTTLAKKYYEEFLTKYPDHELAEDVKQLIAVVDISPEELIKRFKEQNKQ